MSSPEYCKVNPVWSGVCSEGTKGCDVKHETSEDEDAALKQIVSGFAEQVKKQSTIVNTSGAPGDSWAHYCTIICSSELRYVPKPGGSKKLQQAWKCVICGKAIWKDVPTIEGEE